MGITEDYICSSCGFKESSDGDTRRTRTINDDFDCIKRFFDQFEGINQGSQGNDRCTVLIIVENGNI